MTSPDDLWPPWPPVGQAQDRHGGRSRAERSQERAHQMLREHPRGRGRRPPSLSRAAIVDAAIAIADAEGADAVSMRRIAQVLRAGAMTLYWHIANKQHLLDLMLDALNAEVAIPESTGDWRADLRAQALATRAGLLRHRWVVNFIGGRPPLGPNTLLNLDRSLAALDGLGLDTATALNVLLAVQTYVLGAVLREIREVRVQREQEESGTTQAEWEAAEAVWRHKLEADGRFGHFLRILESGVDPDAEETRDERFEFGLDCVLDGIAARVAGLRGRSAR